MKKPLDKFTFGGTLAATRLVALLNSMDKPPRVNHVIHKYQGLMRAVAACDASVSVKTLVLQLIRAKALEATDQAMTWRMNRRVKQDGQLKYGLTTDAAAARTARSPTFCDLERVCSHARNVIATSCREHLRALTGQSPRRREPSPPRNVSCPVCKGSGAEVDPIPDGMGNYSGTRICWSCRGTGRDRLKR